MMQWSKALCSATCCRPIVVVVSRAFSSGGSKGKKQKALHYESPTFPDTAATLDFC
jgi:hypothetical protein